MSWIQLCKVTRFSFLLSRQITCVFRKRCGVSWPCSQEQCNVEMVTYRRTQRYKQIFNSRFCHFITQPGKGTGIYSGGSRFKSRLAGWLVILNESFVVPLSSSRGARDEFQTMHTRNASNGSAIAGLAKSQPEYCERDNTEQKAGVVFIEK